MRKNKNVTKKMQNRTRKLCTYIIYKCLEKIFNY